VGDSAEQAAPYCKDPTRLPDPSTVRRWAQRRLLSVWCWMRAGAQDAHFLWTPTILAWDLGALCGVLPTFNGSPDTPMFPQRQNVPWVVLQILGASS
jgi:hypothetical protein